MKKMTGFDIQKIFGKNVKSNRERMNLTLEGPSEKTGVSKTCIYQYEKGKTFAKAERIAALANSFQIPVSELFKTDDVLPGTPEGFMHEFSEDVKEAVVKITEEYLGKKKV